MNSPWKKRAHEWALTLPSLAWLALFFVIPTIIVFAIAFRPSDPYGGIGEGWTLKTLRDLGNPNYPKIIERTLLLSIGSTAVCLALAVPMAYYMARVSRKYRQILMLLVIIPFWTNFLIRIFAWKVLMHPEGPLKQALVALRLASPSTVLLYRWEAVFLVIIYTSLPFAILPIYAAAEKFDFSLLEAARDLGAGKLTAFWKVFMPGIRRGLVTATLMVLVPALGSYVIPDLVGGSSSEMIGNKIAQRTFVDRNLPHASALASLLTLAALTPMVALLVSRHRRGERVSDT